MLGSLILALLLQLPHDTTPVILTAGGAHGIAKISRHWYDFHKDKPGLVTVKLGQDLRSPMYWVSDVTEPGADFLVIDPSYAHADHFQIKGKKGHKFSWKVAGRR